MTAPVSTTPLAEGHKEESTTPEQRWWKSLSAQQRKAIQTLYADVLREHEARMSGLVQKEEVGKEAA